MVMTLLGAPLVMFTINRPRRDKFSMIMMVTLLMLTK